MKKFLLAAAAVLAISSQANAYDQNYLQFGLGADVIRSSDENPSSVGGRAEWRGKEFDKTSTFGISHISPIIGIDADTRGAAYAFVGLLYDWNFYDRWSLVPNLGFGAYHQGDSKDLGGWFEFHDSIEVDYRLDAKSQVGLALTHMSNAGIYSHNPGKEDLMLTYNFAY